MVCYCKFLRYYVVLFQVITKVDFKGDLQSFISYLKTDPKFFFESKVRVLKYIT